MWRGGQLDDQVLESRASMTRGCEQVDKQKSGQSRELRVASAIPPGKSARYSDGINDHGLSGTSRAIEPNRESHRFSKPNSLSLSVLPIETLADVFPRAL